MVTGLNIIGQNKALQDHEIKRIVAFVIDLIIVVIVTSILAAITFPGAFAIGGAAFIFLNIGAIVLAIIAILYWAIQEAFWGASIGKKVMGLRVVGTTGPIDVVKAIIRNVTKVSGIFLLIDWLVGLGTEGDPRQKLTDRFAGTTVVRTDPQAYVEEQFRQMATPPPHPVAPTGYAPPAGQPAQAWPGQQAPPPGSAPSQQAPAQPPGQQMPGWPQHQWNEQGQLVQPRFCSNCGGPLVPRGDGRLTCSRCGMVY